MNSIKLDAGSKRRKNLPPRWIEFLLDKVTLGRANGFGSGIIDIRRGCSTTRFAGGEIPLPTR